MYVCSKNLRTGGDYGGEAGDYINPYSNYVNSFVGGYVNAGTQTPTVAPVDANPNVYGPPSSINLPPPPPAGVHPWQYYKALNRWENYMVDTNSPPQHLQFNGVLDIPVGRGKRWLSGVNKPLNVLVGGWQIAGAGAIAQQDFYVNTTNWGPTANSGPSKDSIHVYKKRAPITDCRSGICVKAYEWFNGYIPPSVLSSSYTVAGQTGCLGSYPKGITGLPTSWAPYQAPMDVYCPTPGTATTPPVTDKYYGDNDVLMSNVNGQTGSAEVAYGDVPGNNDNGASEGGIDVTNPFGHTVLNGPWNWNADASLFKLLPITERVNLRLNVDAFNVFNHQNLNVPGSNSDSETDGATTGIICTTAGGVGCQSSTFNVPRQIQVTLRLSF